MKKVWPIIALALITGCNENPYPNAGSDISKDKPAPTRTVRPAISVDFQQRVMNFSEGTSDEYKLTARVPKGRPVFNFKGLPDGAVFDKTDNKIKWTPDSKVVDTSINPELRERIFDVDVTVNSSETPSIKSTFKIFLKVNNTRQSTNLSFGTSQWDNLDVKEGQEQSKTLKIESQDFPDGGFDLLISPRIQGMRYEPVPNKPGEYKIYLAPQFDDIHVKDCNGNRWNCKRTIDVTFRVIEPDNHTTRITKKVSFSDVRQSVSANIPESIEMGLNGTFQFISSDPNNEVEPRVELNSLKPEFGNFKIESESFVATNKSTLTKISWTDIPRSMIGQEETLFFRVCNYDYDDYSNGSFRDPSNCTTKSIDIKIVQNERPAPSITRDDWGPNKRKYLLVGEKITETVGFEVGEGEDDPTIELVKPKVVADGQGGDLPPENKVQIGQLGSNIRMQVEAVTPGPAQFTVRLTSAYGIQHTESFIYEVLPADWSSILVLGESKRSQEQQNMEANIENYDFINPFNTELKFPVTLKRDTVVIGTDILRDMPSDDFFVNLMEQFDNIIFASPLIADLPQIVLAQFSAQSVQVKNQRIKQQDPNVDFNQLEITVDKDVITANDKVATFRGDSTTESDNPATLFVKRNSKCKTAMYIADNQSQMEYPLTAVCKSLKGGKIILMGAEWGEFKMEATETTLPQKWFNELLNLELDNE